ncbi:MAG: pectate lyase [Spirochaetales bacterium]|nr:pectate lyase [Spirochaetales bacterium]
MRIYTIIITILILLLCGCETVSIYDAGPLAKEYRAIPMSVFQDSILHARYEFKDYQPPYPVYTAKQIAGVAENMLLLQREDGGWPKNVDWMQILDEKSLVSVRSAASGEKSTLDNRSTYSHIDYLAQVYAQIPNENYKKSIEKGIAWMLSVQNRDSGGFSGADVDAVTYNDDVMTGVLTTLRGIGRNDKLYGFLDQEIRQKAMDSYFRGLKCVLDTQIKIKGKLTAWCQQHDHKTLQPIWARNYEPPSITASESVGILIMLMEIDDPSESVKKAIIAGCEWLESATIFGKKLVRIPAPPATLNGRYSDYERVMEDDASATPIWCRFYDLETQKPLLYDRNFKKVNHYNEISRERRVGYSYFGTWPEPLLNSVYPAWRKKMGLDK